MRLHPTDYTDEMAEFVASGEMIREMDGVIMTGSSNGYYHLRNHWIEDDVMCIHIYREDGTFDGPTIVRDGDFGEEAMLVPGSRSLSANGFHRCGLLNDGTVVCYEYSSIAAGRHHSCGIVADGAIRCWGARWSVQTGPPDGVFTQVTVGEAHSCALRPDGTVECWGTATPAKPCLPRMFDSPRSPPPTCIPAASRPKALSVAVG